MSPIPPKIERKRFTFTYLILAVLAIFTIQDIWARATGPVELTYSEFRAALKEGKIQEVTLTTQAITGILKEPHQGTGKSSFTTTRVDLDTARDLEQYGIRYGGAVESTLILTLLSWIVPAAIFFAFWLFLMRRLARSGPGAGLMSVGKSKAKVFVETDIKVRFTDVAGVDEARQELEEIVAFLKDPKSHGRLGARCPKGVLLVGPPGTGKTLLARAVAGEAQVPFFSISGSEFVEMFVGVGAARVRDLFEQARQKAPCIIFIDELDALGRARGVAGVYGGHDEKEQTLNQLLVELDGFDPRSGIVLLAATNRPEILDPALLRAGRFDRQILVDRPDKAGRVAILRVHVRKVTLSPDVDIEAVAALTPGFTGADIANLVNEAALAATRRNATTIGMEDFNTAIERIVAGLEKKNRLLNPREREIVAHHEMGHAIVGAAMPGLDVVHKISIIPRGIGALGYTIQRPTEDRYLMTKDEFERKIAVLMGGRAAEKLVFGHTSSGAADDLARATEIARSMVTRFAMAPELGHVSYETDPESMLGAAQGPFARRTVSDETAREIDCALRGILETSFLKSIDILRQNRGVLDDGAALLLAKETLDGKELSTLLGRIEGAEPAPAATVFRGKD